MQDSGGSVSERDNKPDNQVQRDNEADVRRLIAELESGEGIEANLSALGIKDERKEFLKDKTRCPDCPIKQYLRKNGISDWGVGTLIFWQYDTNVNFTMSDKTRSFIRKVDELAFNENL